MVKVKLYIEGGGDSRLEAIQFRDGWHSFLGKAGLMRRLTVIRGGGREKTFDAFQTALKTRRPDEFPLLLVDSEDLVAEGSTAWAHLQIRDGWSKPDEAGDDAYLMICCMETWLLADREALQTFFPKLIQKHVPHWPDVEKVPKKTVLSALERATAKCDKTYQKGRVSFELLGQIQPGTVEQKCAAAGLLLERLRGLLN